MEDLLTDCVLMENRLIAQSEHLAETHLSDADLTLDLAEREISCIGTLDLDFDIIAVAAGFTKQTIAAATRDPGQSLFACAGWSIREPFLTTNPPTDIDLDIGDANIDDFLFKPLQNLVNHARNAKVVTK